MPQDVVWTTTFREQELFELCDRPAGSDEQVENIGTISAFKLQVFDQNENQERVYFEESGVLDQGTLTMFGSAQLDNRWTRDSVGYTARWVIDPTSWSPVAKGGRKYLIRMEYQTDSSQNRPNTVVITRVLGTCKFDTSTS